MKRPTNLEISNFGMLKKYIQVIGLISLFISVEKEYGGSKKDWGQNHILKNDY